MLHLGVGVLYLAAGLVAPLWAVLLLWAGWLVLAYLLVRLWARRAPLALLVPLAAIGLILGVVTAGEQGVHHVLRCFLADLDLQAGLAGHTSVAELSPDSLQRV